MRFAILFYEKRYKVISVTGPILKLHINVQSCDFITCNYLEKLNVISTNNSLLLLLQK